MSASAPPDAPGRPPKSSRARWSTLQLLLRADDLTALRRWAADEDRPVDLHAQRLLRLAIAERRRADDAP